MISGVFKYNGESGFKKIQQAMSFLRYCGQLKSAGAGEHPHAYQKLTFQQGHEETFPGIITKDMWQSYTPKKLEVVLVDDTVADRQDIGRIVVYDATGAKQPFEMTEAFYKVVSDRIEGTKVKYTAPTGDIKLVVS